MIYRNALLIYFGFLAGCTLLAASRITPESKRNALLESAERVFPDQTPLDSALLTSLSNPFNPNRAAVASAQDPVSKEAADAAFLARIMADYRPRGVLTRGTRILFQTSEGFGVIPGGSFKVALADKTTVTVKLESVTKESYTVSYGGARLTKPFNDTKASNPAPKP